MDKFNMSGILHSCNVAFAVVLAAMVKNGVSVGEIE